MLRNFLPKTQQSTCILQKSPKWPTCIAALSTAPATSAHQLEQAHIDEVVRLNPNLSAVAPELWQRTHRTFINHGFETSNFLRIIAGNPPVLMRPPPKIIESLEFWRSCQFGEKLLFLLLTKYPELLDVSDERRLLTHIGYLKSFAGNSKNVWKLLMNSPDLMEQSEERIEKKLQYLQKIMRIEMPEIVKSEAISKTYDEIHCRHVFLERLALFKPRPLKADSSYRSKNPRLYQITDTSDKTFATKICHVTLPEYEAFKELFAREMERKRNKESDDELSDEE